MNNIDKSIKIFDLLLNKYVILFIDSIISFEINKILNNCDIILKGTDKKYNVSLDNMEKIINYIKHINYLERIFSKWKQYKLVNILGV